MQKLKQYNSEDFICVSILTFPSHNVSSMKISRIFLTLEYHKNYRSTAVHGRKPSLWLYTHHTMFPESTLYFVYKSFNLTHNYH